ncbi:hypothetical protein E2562_015590 [Oryza meyeriana var. granulata]|uniref:Uncharacterized protein n=1 Tax=Oryza meyeriana var. granulata TaxID=110450 RepID=A0A6G1EKH5_9ORYZ|nr:hypothetical protein E2562_015590 [Oryza meyeriana var. granulata]
MACPKKQQHKQVQNKASANRVRSAFSNHRAFHIIGILMLFWDVIVYGDINTIGIFQIIYTFLYNTSIQRFRCSFIFVPGTSLPHSLGTYTI